ncbi:cytidine deaminase [Candidatus Peregrinibacteria bacterium CG10_big_fil_rev_8_21_14_0_10_49_16]|nr:MAG: cytidine deaminase [Candidatus Peregrinibacteria bacterium CG22_combo_CG10-13_8_21_14_all_49_11]PIR52392.1 MAG: cytidine deaminase [Candidatus Peregrinibacteria bacterium CG10_big_fil_rev_8_21_14_0_10_49_16]
MELIPISTGILKPGDDIATVVQQTILLHEGDILVFSSKAVATVEGAHIDLADIQPSPEAYLLAKACGQTPESREATLQELHRMNGRIAGKCPRALLTELQPNGMTQGSILVASAGLDHSNTKAGTVIGWPRDPVESIRRLRKVLEVAVILSDSCLRPARKGVTAFAIAVSGINPFRSDIGRPDIFGKPLKMTVEAVADQLATAANILMGNADQCIPAVVIRDSGIALSDFEGWVPGIEPEQDIFRDLTLAQAREIG